MMARRIPFREIMQQMLLMRDIKAEDEQDKAVRVRLQRLFRWATTTPHGFAAAEVADILEGRRSA